ncbi:MAG: hypothetical protein A2Y62_12675 [Candidatus Fischerbacteria bacterium RBG_13_37_8]|uniref:Protein-glutamate methylesterase/protein-glutamine glutaminase n=1 Tax=Candidatus Fischerbacteria bacterium RBG_13_37_8 TaxID=1817863 RepID=A0A1F5VQG4_9BACT|nr:MAG: hypothetical protein A2Y62_12675 [Candidatus Fischerbacteria bacterium RBG_13_37_8]
MAIKRMLSEEPLIQIVGAAVNGEELIANLSQWNPDVITLDLSMPGMGGLKTLDYIMEWKYVPVIILSTHSSKDAPMTIEALHRGAVDFIDKQEYSLMDFDALRKVLIDKIFQVVSGTKLLSEHAIQKSEELIPSEKAPEAISVIAEPGYFKAILIGASTGGPPAIQLILESLGSSLPIPIGIVQHMPAGFTKAFAERLNAHLPFRVQEACDEEPFLPGTIYIGPTGHHFLLETRNNLIYTVLSSEPEGLSHKPSVDVLFESAAQIYGKQIIGILLTGMGRDGSSGLLQLKKQGAYTIAQNETTCVVFGMPKTAIQAGAVKEILPLGMISRRILELLYGT